MALLESRRRFSRFASRAFTGRS